MSATNLIELGSAQQFSFQNRNELFLYYFNIISQRGRERLFAFQIQTIPILLYHPPFRC